MLERVGSGVVGSELRIEIAQDSDAYGVVHALIVLEGKQRPGISELRKVRCVMPRRIQAREAGGCSTVLRDYLSLLK